MNGYVYKSTGSWYIVKNEEGEAIQCPHKREIQN